MRYLAREAGIRQFLDIGTGHPHRELCENIRTGTISTYSDRQSGEQSARTAIGCVAFLAGLGALGLGVIMMRFAWTATPDPPDGGSTPPTVDGR